MIKYFLNNLILQLFIKKNSKQSFEFFSDFRFKFFFKISLTTCYFEYNFSLEAEDVAKFDLSGLELDVILVYNTKTTKGLLILKQLQK